MATASKRQAAAEDDDTATASAGAIFTPPGIVCFPHVWEPHSFRPGQDGAYSLILCWPEDVDLTDMKKAVQRASVEKFGADEIKKLIKQKKWSWPWRDGEEYEDYGEPFVSGATFVSFKSKNAPGIVNEWAQPIVNQPDFYAGCMARVSALPWPYDTTGNQGCTFLLNNIQKTDDGDRLAEGRKNAEDEFTPVKSGKPPAGKGFESVKGKGGKAPPSAMPDDDDIPF